MNIKKQFLELHQLLLDNSNKKVSTILPQLEELMQSRSGGGSNGKTFIKNEVGEVTHVYCYYHKKWEDVTIVEYGAKKNTATGLNTMCKEGLSMWNKQQRVKKQAKAELLTKVSNGELLPEHLSDALADIEEAAKLIEPRDDEHGYDSHEDIV